MTTDKTFNHLIDAVAEDYCHFIGFVLSHPGLARAKANGTADLAMKHRDAAEARAERLAEALRRYRNEVPLGHQPHMLAHEVDILLRDQENDDARPVNE